MSIHGACNSASDMLRTSNLGCSLLKDEIGVLLCNIDALTDPGMAERLWASQ